MKRSTGILAVILICAAGAFNADASDLKTATVNLSDAIHNHGIAAGAVPGKEDQVADLVMGTVMDLNQSAIRHNKTCEEARQRMMAMLSGQQPRAPGTAEDLAIVQAAMEQYQIASCAMMQAAFK